MNMKANHQAGQTENPRQRNQSRQGQHGSSFGGSLLQNSHARMARPLSCSDPLQLILTKTTVYNSRLNTKDIQRLIQQLSRKFKIRILQLKLTHHQILITVRFQRKKHYLSWIRSLTGLIPRIACGTQKGVPLKQSFWRQRPLTQIIHGIQSHISALRDELKNWLILDLHLNKKKLRQQLIHSTA